MINVRIGNTVDRKTILCQPTDSIQSAIDKVREQYGLIITEDKTMNLGGTTVNPSERGRTFADYGFNEENNSCSLIAVTKADNA